VADGPPEEGWRLHDCVLWVVRTPSGGSHTDSIEAGHGIRLRFSNPGQRTSTTNRGFYHVQKREESTGTLGPAPGRAGARVPLKQPDGGNDDGGRRPRAAQTLCRNRVIRPTLARDYHGQGSDAGVRCDNIPDNFPEVAVVGSEFLLVVPPD
jgi:hypothetical protein